MKILPYIVTLLTAVSADPIKVYRRSNCVCPVGKNGQGSVGSGSIVYGSSIGSGANLGSGSNVGAAGSNAGTGTSGSNGISGSSTGSNANVPSTIVQAVQHKFPGQSASVQSVISLGNGGTAYVITYVDISISTNVGVTFINGVQTTTTSTVTATLTVTTTSTVGAATSAPSGTGIANPVGQSSASKPAGQSSNAASGTSVATNTGSAAQPTTASTIQVYNVTATSSPSGRRRLVGNVFTMGLQLTIDTTQTCPGASDGFIVLSASGSIQGNGTSVSLTLLPPGGGQFFSADNCFFPNRAPDYFDASGLTLVGSDGQFYNQRTSSAGPTLRFGTSEMNFTEVADTVTAVLASSGSSTSQQPSSATAPSSATFIPPSSATAPSSITFIPPSSASAPSSATFVPPSSATAPSSVTFTPPSSATAPSSITSVPPSSTTASSSITFVPTSSVPVTQTFVISAAGPTATLTSTWVIDRSVSCIGMPQTNPGFRIVQAFNTYLSGKNDRYSFNNVSLNLDPSFNFGTRGNCFYPDATTKIDAFGVLFNDGTGNGQNYAISQDDNAFYGYRITVAQRFTNTLLTDPGAQFFSQRTNSIAPPPASTSKSSATATVTRETYSVKATGQIAQITGTVVIDKTQTCMNSPSGSQGNPIIDAPALFFNATQSTQPLNNVQIYTSPLGPSSAGTNCFYPQQAAQFDSKNLTFTDRQTDLLYRIRMTTSVTQIGILVSNDSPNPPVARDDTVQFLSVIIGSS